jgi:signal transduction histidine kinase
MRWRILVLILAMAVFRMANAQPEAQSMAIQHLVRAQVQGLGPIKEVNLPYQLEATDFDPAGGIVTYKIQVDLASAPVKPVGIYVPKIALSGKISINGYLFGGCESGELKDMRCLHHPYLFEIAPIYWKAGPNELQFDIYVTARQSNGLSSVWVGDVDVLYANFYRWRHWVQVELITGLTWLSVLVGLLAIGAGLVLRKDSVYFWFGLTSFANGLTTGSLLASRVAFDADWFNFFVFASRFISASFGLLMFAVFVDKLQPKLRNLGLIYTLVSVVAIGFSGNDRNLVLILYLPLFGAGAVLLINMIYATWQTQQTKNAAATGMMLLILMAGGYDWLRVKGDTAFEGVYLIAYAYSGVLLLLGSMLFGHLAVELLESRKSSAQLKNSIDERTAELEDTYKRLLASELEVSKTQEQNRLIQDVHDGFGTQLVTANMMAKNGMLTQEALIMILDECIADLYLVITTFGNNQQSLSEALSALQFRLEQRLQGSALKSHWSVQLNQIPAISNSTVLQILRIIQEGLANAIKHAKAENIWIVASYEPLAAKLTVSITDDGIGFKTQAAKGRGIPNMRARALKIGAALTICNGQSGARLALSINLNQAMEKTLS